MARRDGEAIAVMAVMATMRSVGRHAMAGPLCVLRIVPDTLRNGSVGYTAVISVGIAGSPRIRLWAERGSSASAWA